MKKYIGMRYDEKGFDTLEEAGCWLNSMANHGEFYIAELKLDRQYELCAYLAYNRAIEKARKEGYKEGMKAVSEAAYKRGYEHAKKEIIGKLGL